MKVYFEYPVPIFRESLRRMSFDGPVRVCDACVPGMLTACLYFPFHNILSGRGFIALSDCTIHFAPHGSLLNHNLIG